MKYILVLLLLISNTSKVIAQQVNTEAIVSFWQLTDKLKKDRPLTDSMWLAYYNLDGNRKYMENNRDAESAAMHRQYLELVFRPSLADSLLRFEKIQTNFSNDIFENLQYIKSHEAKLRLYERVITPPAYLAYCIHLAKKFLPVNKYKGVPKNLSIYLQGISFDAAVQDSSMYFGITRIYEYDRYRKGLLAAHEFHHVLRINRDISKNVSAADSASFSIIDQINSEGTADLIDKTIALQNEATIFRGRGIRKRLIDMADSTIKKLDTSFILNAGSAENFITASAFSRITNYSSGHMPGLYMVLVIKRNGYEQELINHNDNPFNFFYLYNKAAAKDPKKPARFSAAAIRCLQQLESRVY